MGITALVMALSAVALAVGQPKDRWDEEAQREFLKSHWQVPIPPQGKPPARFSPLEASLAPKSCGVCHVPQYEQWKTSLHAKSMGPGVSGQLLDMLANDPETALHCYTCHAPLTEQQEQHRVKNAEGAWVMVANPSFDATLREKGLACAACHVRSHERFGPPKRDGSLESAMPRDRLPHNGVIRTPAFLRSQFCQGCHQFDEDGFALNGKLLENTYNEWKASPYAKQGVQCQDCHMPDRQHLWRGIHDPEMVKKGVTIQLKTGKPLYKVGEMLRATLTVTNSGVGHFFPTYVTPKVFVRAELVDGQGKTIPGSVQEATIGREVPLDLSQELFDTRIPPKETYTLKYSKKVPRKGLKLRARVMVHPDHFYERFFQAILPSAEKGRAFIEEALKATKRSSFTLFEQEVPLS